MNNSSVGMGCSWPLKKGGARFLTTGVTYTHYPLSGYVIFLMGVTPNGKSDSIL